MRKPTSRVARSSKADVERVTMKSLWELVAWVHRSDLRMMGFWAVLCGGLLLALLATGSLDAFLTGEPTELSGPIAKRW
jgi:hypothetical protein